MEKHFNFSNAHKDLIARDVEHVLGWSCFLHAPRLSSYVIRLRSALIALTRATWAWDRRPCFVCAAAARAMPSAVRGPVDLPPCNLHRFLPLMAGFLHGDPLRVLAPQRWPGQSGPKRVAWPTLKSVWWLTVFTNNNCRSGG